MSADVYAGHPKFKMPIGTLKQLGLGRVVSVQFSMRIPIPDIPCPSSSGASPHLLVCRVIQNGRFRPWITTDVVLPQGMQVSVVYVFDHIRPSVGSFNRWTVRKEARRSLGIIPSNLVEGPALAARDTGAQLRRWHSAPISFTIDGRGSNPDTAALVTRLMLTSGVFPHRCFTAISWTNPMR